MIEALVPAVVRAADVLGDLPGEPLFPQEEDLVRTAAEGRRQEFRTVRGCARRALAGLGITRPPLVPGEHGEPSWPRGVVGSMTHCSGYRAAAVAPAADVVALGIDAEPHDALPADVLDVVAGPREQDRCALAAGRMPGIHWDRLLFSAKESVYKAWFPLTRRGLGFRDVDVVLHPESGAFDVTFLVPPPAVAGRELRQVGGRWLVTHGLALTSVVLLRP